MPKIFSERDREVIRGKLLDEGMRELEHKGYRSISVDSITSGAGIAKGTFYAFFNSKEEFFYEIFQLIKERNRIELREAAKNGLTKEKAVELLCRRYTRTKTVYDYFTVEDMRVIIRKLPQGDCRNDSAEFAEYICECADVDRSKVRPDVIVNLCNILALAAANRNILEEAAYSETIRVLCGALADYIFGGK